jgi:hypothetical protein
VCAFQSCIMMASLFGRKRADAPAPQPKVPANSMLNAVMGGALAPSGASTLTLEERAAGVTTKIAAKKAELQAVIKRIQDPKCTPTERAGCMTRAGMITNQIKHMESIRDSLLDHNVRLEKVAFSAETGAAIVAATKALRETDPTGERMEKLKEDMEESTDFLADMESVGGDMFLGSTRKPEFSMEEMAETCGLLPVGTTPIEPVGAAPDEREFLGRFPPVTAPPPQRRGVTQAEELAAFEALFPAAPAGVSRAAMTTVGQVGSVPVAASVPTDAPISMSMKRLGVSSITIDDL